MRVIGGQARGNRLEVPRGWQTRPTSDRVKEALFNIITPEVAGSAFLDVFAGTGNVGLEAISRGASQAVFIENDLKALKVIRKNIIHLGFETSTRVIPKDFAGALKLLAKQGEVFDLIYIDPPYGRGLVDRTLELIIVGGIINKKSLIIGEVGKKEPVPQGRDWKPVRREVYGDTALVFFLPDNSEPDN